MSSEKKDLTRIEDLSEYLHELNEDEASNSFGPPEDLPQEETDFSQTDTFELTTETPEFVASEEGPVFESENPTSSEISSVDELDFGSSEESTFTTAEESTEFDSTDFSSFDSSPIQQEEAYDPLATSVIEPEAAYVPGPQSTSTPEQTHQAPENFQDVKKFTESSTVTNTSAEANPSFSVLVKNVRYIEDVSDIIAIMRDLALLNDSEDQVRSRLMRGQLLVPRISEYAAIFLAHKLRRFDIDIQVGLSDEIHPPKHQETPETGLVSKHSIYQNQTHHFHFDDPKLEMAQIIIAASPNLEGHQVIRYLGVASEHKILEGHIVEDEGPTDIPHHYSELAQKLKAHALKAHANAVIGLNYQLTPLPSEFGMSHSKYRLSCTGNLVWVNKL